MRKIIALWLAALLLAVQPVQAVVCVGFGQSSSAVCLSGTYIFGWGGEWTGDTDKACEGSSDTTGVDGTVYGSPEISTTYGESGSDVALRADANNEYIKWSDSGGSRIDINGARTLWMRVYISAAPTNDTRLFIASGDTTNNIYCVARSSASIMCTHRIGASVPTAYSDAYFSTGTWFDFAYSWDFPNGDHSVNLASAWADDNNEIGTTEGVDVVEFSVGTNGGFSMGTGESIRISKFAVLDGYKTAKPW